MPRWGALRNYGSIAWVVVALLPLAAADPTPDEAKSLIPWNKLDDKTRAKLEEVVNDATIYYRTPSEVFATSPELYLLLLHEPVLTLDLWRTLGASPASVEKTADGQFKGSDGHASTGQWEFVYKSPDVHVIYAEGQYLGPFLGSTLNTKSVLVLRTVFFQEADGKQYVKHQLDGFVKAESGNLKPLAQSLRPLFKKTVQTTMQESLWFVSLLCRFAGHDPHAVMRALEHADNASDTAKTRLREIITPMLAANPPRATPKSTVKQ